MKNYDVLNDLIPKTQELHRAIFDKGYEQGQTDVLKKIRAEVEQNAYPIVHGVNSHEKGMTLYGILQIIDKYREVSE